MIDSESIAIEITQEDCQQFKRLDHLLTQRIHSLSRSSLKKLYQQGLIVPVQNIPLEFNKMPPAGTQVHVFVLPPPPEEMAPEDIPLDIVHEDEHLLFIDKPAGMVVHPAPGNPTGTLVNALLHHFPPLKNVGEPTRPGIVHRIDKGTTGLLVVAKEQPCYEGLRALFDTHSIERKYQALVHGHPIPPHGKLVCTIGRNPHNRLKMKAHIQGGKEAISYYAVKESFGQFSHLELSLETGRTHQIRIQLSHLLKKPILGDALYGGKNRALPAPLKALMDQHPYPLLHARHLGLVHPITAQKIVFEAEPHKIFSQFLQYFQQNNV